MHTRPATSPFLWGGGWKKGWEAKNWGQIFYFPLKNKTRENSLLFSFPEMIKTELSLPTCFQVWASQANSFLTFPVKVYHFLWHSRNFNTFWTWDLIKQTVYIFCKIPCLDYNYSQLHSLYGYSISILSIRQKGNMTFLKIYRWN